MMASILTEMDSLHKETEQEQKILVRLCGKLGREALSSDGRVSFPENPKLVSEVMASRSAYDASSERLASLKNALFEINESGTTITNVRIRLKDLEAQRLKLYSVLGAVAAESYDVGLLPEDLDFAVAPLKSYRQDHDRIEAKNKGSASPLMAFIHSKQIKSLEKKLEDVYCQIGRLIAQSGEGRLLSGARAESVFIELGNIDRIRDSLNVEISRRSEKLSQAKDSVTNLRLREVELECDRLKDAAEKKEQEYGTFLVSKMPDWIGPDCPAELLKCCDEIREQKRRIYLRQIQSRLLSFDKAIEICEGRIAQYKDRIDYLDTQISALAVQKNDMESKIASEEQNIESCRLQQKAIQTLAQENKDV